LWLVAYHDVLGNIYTGERAPNFLADIVQEMPSSEIERHLGLLQIVTLCDLRGRWNGQYLTDMKAQFWLSLSNLAQIQQRQRDLFAWRVERWTGDLIGRPDPDAQEKLKRILRQSQGGVTYEMVQSVFAERILLVTYGFYLFTALSTEQLATLMSRVSREVACLDIHDVTLNLETRYRPGNEQALRHYTDQLDQNRLDLRAELNRKPSASHTKIAESCMLICP
jgi:hypothetical protein